MKITYGMHQTQFGNCLIALINNKICCVAFLQNNESPENYLLYLWPTAQLIEGFTETKSIAEKMFNETGTFEVYLEGTEFQKQVWRALQKIPAGTTSSYQSVAQMIGKPQAHRAIATAIASNRIAYLIPCHRVTRKSGEVGKYRWGTSLKKALIAHEQL